MPSKTEMQDGVPDHENPEWTTERLRGAMRFSDLPEEVQAAAKRRSRGPQLLPLKERTSIRLSPDVMAALKATGPGWQTRADDALRKVFVRQMETFSVVAR